jgi:hypothetical protein
VETHLSYSPAGLRAIPMLPPMEPPATAVTEYLDMAQAVQGARTLNSHTWLCRHIGQVDVFMTPAIVFYRDGN